jgi:long-subunit acyl-CoA synthetase (AMP-forming)
LGSPVTKKVKNVKTGLQELKYLRYNYRTYTECINDALAFGSALIKKDLCPEINDFKDYKCRFISVFAPNIENWYLIDLACMSYGL